MTDLDLDYQQPPFDLLDESERARLRKATDMVFFARGERPVQCDVPSTAVFVVYRGRRQALREGDAGIVRLGDYGPGAAVRAISVMMG